MAIDAARWPEVTALFGELLPLEHASRARRLAAVTDADLREEVRSLLQAEASAGSRFDRAPLLAPPATPPDVQTLEGTSIGPWRIVRRIGEGGMGTVYEAVRDTGGFTKQAALKVINARGATDPGLIQRFEVERRIVARLAHRNIATLLDGGVHRDGQPWFALEYVDGEPLLQWCASRQLDTRARVQLFRQACSAVQYAHEHLVVHRDLKPANMLVASDGTLKLLDFGIARLTDDSEAALTIPGLSPMTAAYASPEQRAGRVITTATDIWSLGVVLYELLTGARPDVGPLGDTTPMPPSRALSHPALSRTAQTQPDGTVDEGLARRRSRELAGELDAIVLMCLRPEADRRYSSAADLGRDLHRWLEGRTVHARPDTVRYRATVFVRRNRLATVAMAVAVIALVVGTVVSVRQAEIARRERDRARREQARTQRVAAFFQQVLTQANPRTGGRALTVNEALTRAIPIIDTAFTREPDLKAAVQLSVASTLQNLEQDERARPLLRAAYDYFRTHDGPVASHDQTDALWDLAALAQRDGQLAEAESLFVRLVGVYRQPGHAPNDAVLAGLRIASIRVDAGNLTGAITAYDSLLPRLQLRTREDSLDIATNIASRGVALATLGTFDRARADFARALALNESLLGPDSFVTGQILQPYAGVMLFSGRLVEAEALARRALVISQREFGDGTATSLAAARMLGTVLVAARRCDEAIAVFSRILAQRGSAITGSDPTVGYALAHRGFCRAETGDVRGGIADARQALRTSAAALGTQHYAYHLAQSLAGATLAHGSVAERDEAQRLLEAGVNGLRRTLDPAHPRVRDAEARLAAFGQQPRTSVNR